MARHVTEQIASAANELKDKLKIIWSRLKSKSNNLADCIPLHWYNSKFVPTEVGLCLLICSMFPDDHKIPIEELVIYGMGLELFEDVHDMFAARCRVRDIISLINDQTYPRAIGGKTRLAIEKDGPHDHCEANLHCQSFSFADLEITTGNFGYYDESSGIALNTAYKGWIDEETFAPSKTMTAMPVSINRLSIESMQQMIECQLQLNILEKLSHPNLVKCIGYCWVNRHLFLVFEFMERGNLFNHLFNFRSSDYPLSWDLRIKIAIGAARGLDFLHTQKNVIHRDIKASAIMLYRNYNAKLSGFELAIFGPPDGDSHVTTTVMGTYGYTDPEYIATGHCSIKSDVYSFGVVLLELMTGLRTVDVTRPKEQQNLVDWSKSILSQKRTLINIVDTRIKGQYSSKAMLLAAQLSLRCLESEAKNRPSMKEVVDALEQIKVIEEKQTRR
ncbi:Protein kinase superfamily protein [Euphorbia peplus]|nr:Protein kinase superfamily protein [Euphorbia peplus]